MTSDCSQLYCNVYNKFDKKHTGDRVAGCPGSCSYLGVCGLVARSYLAFANFFFYCSTTTTRNEQRHLKGIPSSHFTTRTADSEKYLTRYMAVFLFSQTAHPRCTSAPRLHGMHNCKHLAPIPPPEEKGLAKTHLRSLGRCTAPNHQPPRAQSRMPHRSRSTLYGGALNGPATCCTAVHVEGLVP